MMESFDVVCFGYSSTAAPWGDELYRLLMEYFRKWSLENALRVKTSVPISSVPFMFQGASNERHLFHAQELLLTKEATLGIYANDGRYDSQDRGKRLHLDALAAKLPVFIIWTDPSVDEEFPPVSEEEKKPGVVLLRGDMGHLAKYVFYLLCSYLDVRVGIAFEPTKTCEE